MPDRCTTARPRQPAAGRRPPHLPRVRRDRPPSSPGGRDRRLGPSTPHDPADSGRHWLSSDGALRAASRHRRTTVLASTPRRLPAGSARTLQGGADVGGAAESASADPSQRRHTGSSPVPRDARRPRVSDRTGPGHPAVPQAPRSRESGTGTVSGPRSGCGAMLDDVACCVDLPAGRRALPEALGSARPGPGPDDLLPARTPAARRSRPDRNAGSACARYVPVEGTHP